MDRIELIKLNIAGTYQLKDGMSTNGVCAICKQSLTGPSPIDMQKMNLLVIVSIGKCNDCYHKSCIDAHISNGNISCPIDQTPWTLKEDFILKNSFQ